MNSTTKFLAAAAVAAIGLAIVLNRCCCDNSSDKPNVILITLDTTRADYLSCYGYPVETTPHMDKLASEGVMFTRAMSTSSLTPVSHGSILTGLYQYKHGIRVMFADSGFRLAPDTQSFATVLKKRGYTLAAIHSSFPVSNFFGFNQGYDVFDSFEKADVGDRSWPKVDSKGAPVLDDSGQPLMNELTGWSTEGATRRSDDTTDRALSFLESAEGPFFLWIHYWDPHDADVAPPDEFMNGKGLVKNPGGYYRRTDEFYAEEVRYLDSQIGRLFAGLREQGLYEDSLIVLTADHGDGLSDGEKNHGWKAHRELYVEQLNVPLMFKFPQGTSGFKAGLEVDQLVSTVDIFPTVCDYLDIALTELVNGVSLRDLVEERAADPRIFYADQVKAFDKNAAMTENRPKALLIYAAMNNEWKLIYRPTEEDPKELYHIASDPRELKNVAAANPEIVNELMLELAGRGGWVTEEFQLHGAPVEQPDRALEGLGYVGRVGEYKGTFDWVCPIGHTRREIKRGDCTECGNPLVPLAQPVTEPAEETETESKPKEE